MNNVRLTIDAFYKSVPPFEARMSIQHPYRQLDEVAADGDHLHVSSYSSLFHRRVQPDSETDADARSSLANIKWPRMVGVVQIVNGFLTGLLGALEVFIIPLLEDVRDEHAIVIGKRNCYAAGLFAGLMMIMTGSTAVRSSISQRGSTIQRYVILSIISVLFYLGFSVLLVVGYSKGWTAKDKYPPDSSLYEVHIFLTASILLGLLFVLTALIQYAQTVCFGDIQLARKCTLFFCRACCYKEEDPAAIDNNALV